MADDAIRFEHRMSDMDALMWSIEKDPLLRSTITAVAILDASPDRDRLIDKIQRGLVQIPRLRQRAVTPPLGVAPPQWVVDRNFDLDYHLRWVKAPGDGSLRALLDFTEPIAMQSFDRARPLWEFYVVEGLEDGRAALIQKIHHSVTDGVGGIKLALMLLDMERNPSSPPEPLPELEPADEPRPFDLLREGILHEQRRRLGIARRSVAALRDAVRDPASAVRNSADVGSSLARLLAPAFEPLSPLMTGRSLSVHFETVTAQLSALKAAAKKADGKLNDAFVAAVAGGFARYHDRKGVPATSLRMAMPINIRDNSTEGLAGNQFTPARFPIPVDIADPIERMRTIRQLVRQARDEPALSFAEPIAGVLNRLPTSVTTQLFGSMLKGVDIVTSNVPGVPFPVFLAGGKLEAQFAFGPLAGAACNLTLLSYVDELHVGVNCDVAAVDDPGLLHECLNEGFEEVVKLA
jgi:diacylglycerol O-acyltransferase / wax synthase